MNENSAVVISTDRLLGILRRSVELEQLARRQAERLEEQRVLLRSAVFELAVCREERVPEHFYSRWLNQHRDSPLRERLGGGWR